jgi:predicted  nucleic acid-binding Zn-ribbon protein
MNEIIKAAKDKGDSSSVQCEKCKQYMPKSTFHPYDTNVWINGQLLIKGYEEICGGCYYTLYDKVFSKVSGAMQYAREKQSKRSAKANKTKIS